MQSFPTFVYVEPNTKGLKAIVYRGDRNYEQMKSWMREILGPVALGTFDQGFSSDITEQLEELTRLF